MAALHQVTCIRPDGLDADRRIDRIGGSVGSEQNGGAWSISIDEAIAGIKSGKWLFWTTVGNHRVNVIIARRTNGREYLKTEADGIEPNNLLALPHAA